MANKFTSLDDAAAQLGITKERLNEIREAGQLRAYRDGGSWKFRTDEIETMATQGIPSSDSSADMTGGFGAGPEEKPIGIDNDSINLEESGLKLEGLSDLDLAEESDIAPDVEKAIGESTHQIGSGDDLSLEAAASDPDLLPIEEPTVPADSDPADTAAAASVDDADDELVIEPLGEGDDAESILLSDMELDLTSDRPPSTIIGRSELPSDDDLELAIENESKAGKSDVRLADSQSGVLSLEDAGSAIISGASESASNAFEDLDELEIDLEAESSRILEADDLAKAQEAAKSQAAEKSDDLSLADSDLQLASESVTGLSGLSGLAAGQSDDELELAGASALGNDPLASDIASPGSSPVLADDDEDDFVLGDSDSDVTLTGADSGINLAPADSGLALDEVALDLGGSAMGSSLDLGESFGVSLSGEDSDASVVSDELGGDQDFLLQPVADEESDVEDDSSQIIALEEVGEDDDDEVLLGDDGGFGMDGGEAAAGVAAASVVASDESQFGALTIGLLSCSLALMLVCGVLSIDMIRSVWSWEEPYGVNSAILDGLASMMGLRG